MPDLPVEGERREWLERRLEEEAGSMMSKAVGALGVAAVAMRSTERQAWAAEIEALAVHAKRVRDAIYRRTGCAANRIVR